MTDTERLEIINAVLDHTRDMHRVELQSLIKDLNKRIEVLQVRLDACEIAMQRKNMRARNK